MAIYINYNPSTLKVQRNLASATNAMNKALERMSTGFKVNCAADDAAGMYVSTGLTTHIRGLTQAIKNAQDGISYLNTAGGSLGNMTNILSRLRDLSVQGSNGVYDDAARAAMQAEADALTAQLYQIKNGTRFNGRNIFGANEASPFSTFSIRGIRQTTKSSLEDPRGSPRTGSGEFMNPVTRMSEAEAIAAGYTVIKTAAELDAVRNNLSGKYMLMGDIDLSGFANWDPLGYAGMEFRGIFDGNGYVVSNMKIDRPMQSIAGLFGMTSSAIIQNVGVENVDVKGMNSVGGLVGCNYEISIISNSYSTGTVSGSNNVGGLVGYNNTNGRITNSYATGTVTGDKRVGGLVGENYFQTEITNSYAAVAVLGNQFTGGLVGNNIRGTVTNSYATGTVSGNWMTGGLIGNNDSNSIVTNSYATGKVSGMDYTGGLVGSNGNYSTITNSFWDTEKTGQTVGIGTNNVTDPTKVIIKGLNSLQMTDSKNFTDAGWSTNDWWFEAGQPPKLAWQKPPVPPIPPIPTGDTVLRLQVGANSDDDSAIFFDAGFSLGTFSVDFTDEETSRASIEGVDEILDRINAKNAEFGAILNRLDSVLQSQTTQIENLTASRSTIMDADIAEESAILVKNRILQQTSATLLVQSQSLQKQTILRLIVR